jgi:hypothetical protein
MNVIQHNKLRTIVLSVENYDKLKRLGYTSESFNTVIGRLLEQVEEADRK